MFNKLILLFLAILLATSTVFSQEYKNEFGFKSDNDAYLWYGQDRYYTNGLFIYFRRAVDQQNLRDGLEKVIYEVSAGQKMYNPISGHSPNPFRQDRPFAAHLFVESKKSFFYKKERLLKVGLNLGVVGPKALGKEVQSLLHNVVGFYEVKGWDYQIENQLAVNATAQYATLLHRTSDNIADFTLDGNLNLGTTNNNANLGILFRAGDLNQIFNSAQYQAAISNNSKTSKYNREEFYFYAKPQINYTAYDATVEGSLFNEKSPVTFETRPFVFSQQVGFNYSTPRFSLDYSLIFLTKEIKSAARPHQYGSIAMFYRFN